MFGFNLFSDAGLEFIHRRLENLKRIHPALSHRELAWVLINEKCWWCALAGCLTAIPAVLPGLGTLVAILGGAAVDIIILGWSITKLTLELAVLYGRNPSTLEAQREALFAFAVATGLHGMNQRLSSLAARQFSKQLTAELFERGLIRLGFRASQRQFIPRLLPFLGVLIAGMINYFFTRAVGAKLLHFYQKNGSPFTGQTIDAQFTTEKIE
ncbi:MAG: hypothetical protein K6U74_11720 [Firmicutes bacterium]|nr:hypothetical protein [Bacillota bacterium]